ncbi:MAG: hypothetical protein JXR46_15255 [Calditrichaceae bacterium]|nr:hypothetical protein [Calditrichaceae bacterium]MBN2710400.1 hypothetical protein [Calditrichaceae bacterium]RQV92878.1 MAG: hypothetical protein EH224_13975 [Calditrichota bacterium]
MKKTLVFLTLVLLLPGFAQDSYVSKVAIHGFVSQGMMWSTDNQYLGKTKEGTFEFNELGLNFSAQLTDEFRIGVQFFARDLGYLGNDEIIVDWAYGDYRFRDWLGIRGGKMKMRLGLYNEFRDLDMTRVNIFMPQGVYNETWRDSYNALKGLGVYGVINIGGFGALDYVLQVGVVNINSKTGVNRYIEDQLYAKFDQYTIKPAYIGSLVWETPLDGLRLAGSFMNTDFSAFGTTETTEFWKNMTLSAVRDYLRSQGVPEQGLPTDYEAARQIFDLVGINIQQEFRNIGAYWISAEYLFKGFSLAAEYYDLFTNYRTSNPQLGALRPWDTNELGGYYGSASYRLNDYLEAGVYYSEYYTNFDDKEGKEYAQLYQFPSSNTYQKDTAVSLRLDLNEYWIIKLEGHSVNGTAIMYRNEQDNPHNVEKDWILMAGKLTYNF